MQKLKSRIFYSKTARKLLYVAVAIVFIIVGLVFSAGAKVFYFGDVNLDGKVSASDARTILHVAAGLAMLDSFDASGCADVNHDNRISAADARLALQIAAKLREVESFAVTEPTTKSSTTQSRPTSTAAKPAATERPTIIEPQSFTVVSVNPYTQGRPSTPEIPKYEKKPDSFVIITYGYGHGVGMSQYGAIGMSLNGYNYLEILSHYFRGVTFVYDEIPETITLHTGQKVDTYELMCRIVQQEIGGNAKHYEALKAQAVTAYTLVKSHDFVIPNALTVAYKSSIDSCSEATKKAVQEVLGLYMAYNGKPISAVFGAMSAGITANEKDVWGGDYPYLEPVPSYYDIEVESFISWCKYINVNTFTSEEMKEHLLSYDSELELSDDPSEWIRILAHDGCVSQQVGYVSQMRICNRTLSSRAGQIFRSSIMDYDIRSHCFSIIYYDENLSEHYS